MNKLAAWLRGLDTATRAWLVLLALTLVSVAAADAAHHGVPRLAMGAAVALVAWTKGQLLLRHYLELWRAGPVFSRLIQAFCALAPLALLASALREALL